MMSMMPTISKRILRPEQGWPCIQNGYLAADLHVHSTCSYDVLPSQEFQPEAIYRKALNLGMDYITITDHDTMAAYDVIGWDREHLVTGVEMSLLDRKRVGHTIHVNVYDLKKYQFDELLRIAQHDQNIETYIGCLRDQKLPYLYNHPFWFSQGDRPNYRAVKDIVELFPVIEYNMKRVRRKNLLALGMAMMERKGILASTDTHIGRIAQSYTLAKGDTFREYFANISQGNAYIIPQDLDLQNLNSEIVGWIELLFRLENVLRGRAHFTGITILDCAINFLANNTSDNYPYSFPIMESLSRKIVKTGFFSFLYLFQQNMNAKKIGKILDIPSLTFDTAP
ncbi:MAG: PHP domain-containing protein [Candidatus Omnitrophota bacterium]